MSGSWGTQTYTDDTDVTVDTVAPSGDTGGYGMLLARSGWFPAGGPWGTPTRVHPDDQSIRVEMVRLGRPLAEHRFELPRAFYKYVIYWALAQAYRREGAGQNLELAAHYGERFEMGVSRLSKRINSMIPESTGHFGDFSGPAPCGGLGDPQMPYPYGLVS